MRNRALIVRMRLMSLRMMRRVKRYRRLAERMCKAVARIRLGAKPIGSTIFPPPPSKLIRSSNYQFSDPKRIH
jgi:hypothetical protein